MRRCQKKADNKKRTFRVRVTSACKECKTKKTKCENARPCTHCRRHKWVCTSEVPTKRGPRKMSDSSLRKKKESKEKEITEVISNVAVSSPTPTPTPTSTPTPTPTPTPSTSNSNSSPISDKSSQSSYMPVLSSSPSSSPISDSNSPHPSPTEEHFFTDISDLPFYLALTQNEIPPEVSRPDHENVEELFKQYIEYEDT
jgi:hypothetical protein